MSDFTVPVFIAHKDLRWLREDFLFVLENLISLKVGIYPQRSTGYTDTPAASGSACAPYEMACNIAAEAEERLRVCGVDGGCLKLHVAYDVELIELAVLTGRSRDEVMRGIRSALSYCSSGECRRWVPCGRCTKRRKCSRAEKGRQQVSYADWKNHTRPPRKSVSVPEADIELLTQAVRKT